MMTADTILADLELRGWVFTNSTMQYWVKQEAMGAYYIRGDMARVAMYVGRFPATAPADISPAQDEETLRRVHDIICRFERGDYEPRADGSPPNVIRVDSHVSPERCGIQNDRPEYGGTPYRRSRKPKWTRKG